MVRLDEGGGGCILDEGGGGCMASTLGHSLDSWAIISG